MTKFKVTYLDPDQQPEEIEADYYDQEGDWFVFNSSDASEFGVHTTPVARIRAVTVSRVDLIEE
ncbi:MAG: hypothetical protein HYU28_05810 [Actinobacteria bacterium]|nr:hypothetical protein [Actinomycetota bacterium]